MEEHLGLRKGAWTREEDVLLTNCIQKYGEGRWHLVPLRSGLNRCQKSCRLRWLNYLKPNIKRGEFAADEVDLIIRLHKLLGNRWSMIARRLPGRTSNDVKNYWNTRLNKKCSSADHDENTVKVTVIKPLPRLITKDLSSYFKLGKTTNDIVQAAAAPPQHVQPTTKDQDDDVFMITNNKPASSDLSEPYSTPPLSTEVEFAWFESSFFDHKEEGLESDNKDQSPPCLGDGNNKENSMSSSLDDREVIPNPALEVGGVDESFITNIIEDSQIDLNQYLAFDMDIWDILNGPNDISPAAI